MPYQLNLAQGLRDFGLIVVEHPGWQTRGNFGFAPKGVVVHHTAIAENLASIKACINGRPDLSGPLTNVVITTDGLCHVIAAGRANHAGSGSWQGLSGNSTVWGIEAVHPGISSTPWPDVQLRAMQRCSAAMIKLSETTESLVCGHKEWTTRKIDPISIHMPSFRAVVKHILEEGVGTMPDHAAPAPPIGIAMSPSGHGYVILLADGAVYGFGDAEYLGRVHESAPGVWKAYNQTIN